MCSASSSAVGLAIAATGSAYTVRPPSTRKPAGVFIQSLVSSANTAEAAPARRLHHTRQPAGEGPDSAPAVEVDPQEDRLGKEGDLHHRERQADDRPGEGHELG